AAPVRGAPGAPGPAAGRRQRGGRRPGGQAGRIRAAGTEVIQVTAPDIADVTSLGVRASDGGSIYRPPNEERYCTLAHLDTEEQILAAARRNMPKLVSEQQARAAAARTGLSAEQRDAVTMMLTAATAMTVLVAPAGA